MPHFLFHAKRIISLLLAFAVLTALFPTLCPQPVSAAQSDAIKSMVAQQYDAYAATLKADTPTDAVTRFMSHSMNNRGTLNMGGSDPFTAALLRSKLLRAAIIDGISDAVASGCAHTEKNLFLRGTISWYEHKLEYGSALYRDNENGNDADDSHIHALPNADAYPYTGAINSYDEAMILLVGQAPMRITLRQTAVTAESITYRVTIQLTDRFDFTGATYSNPNDTFTEVMRLLGLFLSAGLLHDFDWSANAEFELAIPNDCTHKSADYSWEYDGKADLVSSTARGMTANPLSKTMGTTENHVFSKTIYRTQNAIRLMHDRPWVLEIKCAGSGWLSLGSHSTLGGDAVYLRKAANTVFFGQYVPLKETDKTPTLTHYGVWYSGTGISAADDHTYRLTNCIEADGSNMVYLSIDGIDFGPMHHYYHSGTSMHTTNNWLCGKDIEFNYIGTHNASINDVSVDYIRAWENGIDGGSYSHCIPAEKSPTCTDAGYSDLVCTLCSAVVAHSPHPPLGHSYSEWHTEQEASCSAEGLQMRSCGRCGTKETKALPALPHSIAVETIPPTCTEGGYTNHSCTVCGNHYIDAPQDALGHSFTEWQERSPATGTADGTEARSCTACGLEETRTLPQLTHSFTDVPADAYYKEPVLWAVSKAITSGISETLFAPDAVCTRGQVVTFLYRAAGTPDIGASESSFVDVSAEDYYYNAVLWAAANGITAGTDNTHFSPNTPCTRGQVVTFLYRAAGAPDIGASENSFADVSAEDYYYNAVLWAAASSITAGTDDTHFSPDAPCSRAQIVTFLHRSNH